MEMIGVSDRNTGIWEIAKQKIGKHIGEDKGLERSL